MKIQDLKLGDKVMAYVDYKHKTDGINAYPIQGYVREMPNDKRWAKLHCAHGIETITDEDDFELYENKRPNHYGNGKTDLIDYWCQRYNPDELRGAFKSQISKYIDRLGYKDDEVKELNKIIDYATRYRDFLQEDKR
ncbi:DUF3310 domain-containing protein [Staphylococcus chromogenes]|uniref:DUF3310 domain-containing protein n=1 Tax=Staphylococcus chromogenes TaxID=46126 RepID=UPI000CD009E5|nr:DUF3310 domain-containing protein [Staphylococcus chromogenes]MBP0044981.1 DUF3310 domain-containing protein [Staphylococcus chromogenes]MDT0670646.1 DUF3310 domain-containing protein [Staphylococcus chromogenes]PNY96905.1 hypothetical protein CD151_02195 [Staphylococcus chromogenes]SUM13394.1 Protein of unknwon function (DUF3310) [Staphylococcus chromogenes]GGI30913.1 hypothetical protein GCM10008139_06720 [Staphylococcus chromogenes]